eukprot:1238699-Lingulodinium_polyedra.AAC.1
MWPTNSARQSASIWMACVGRRSKSQKGGPCCSGVAMMEPRLWRGTPQPSRWKVARSSERLGRDRSVGAKGL